MEKVNQKAGLQEPYSKYSYHVMSQGYRSTLKRISLNTWYDVFPYSLCLWPHDYSETLRHGSWWYKRNNYPFIAIECILEGDIIYEYGKRRHHAQAGHIFITPPSCSVRISNGECSNVREVQIVVSGGAIRTICESLGLSNPTLLHDDEQHSIEQRLRRIGALLKDAQLSTAAVNSSMAYEILTHLAELKGGQSNGDLPPVLTKAVAIIASGWNGNISELAADLSISCSSLDRLFMANFGKSPHDYITAQRMESAKNFLLTNQFSVKEIASFLGFKNAFYFSRAFSKYTGVPPSHYRHNIKKRD